MFSRIDIRLFTQATLIFGKWALEDIMPTLHPPCYLLSISSYAFILIADQPYCKESGLQKSPFKCVSAYLDFYHYNCASLFILDKILLQISSIQFISCNFFIVCIAFC